MAHSISVYSSKLRTILGKDTHFFIYDPYVRDYKCVYKFKIVSDLPAKPKGGAEQ